MLRYQGVEEQGEYVFLVQRDLYGQKGNCRAWIPPQNYKFPTTEKTLSFEN